MRHLFKEHLINDLLEKDCDTPLEVLASEIKLAKSTAWIIYENINGEFKEIAFLDLREKTK